ncbi:MAG: DNA mismatch repair endonuclease MutL [Deltaproteobacteria bacterium]|nr:DNA mismatch repair endonuclease MutL [Deltaproteobacteria bacterium]
MNIIRILPEKIATQIAAGEVIERPASVVRELIDNSIDAGSDHIVIHIDRGGKGLIKARDNGRGMSKDDLLLCIERHARSKIRDMEDLYAINTLGFRGEALPSIASVSKMEMTTRLHDQLIGFKLRAIGGKLKSIDETGCPAGTMVEVKDIFFNVPARRKFLRSTKTETHHIVDTISKMALPFLYIHFKLMDGEKNILNLPRADNEISRLSVFFGNRTSASMTEARETKNGFSLTMYLGAPDQTKGRGNHILTYVNKRHVRDRLLTKAVIEGYGQRLMKGRYPQAVVFIDSDPSMVDINVHPTKQEVRFQNTQLTYQTLLSAVNTALGGRFHSPGPEPFPPPPPEQAHVSDRVRIAEAVAAYTIPSKKKPVQDALFTQVDEYRIDILGQLKDTYILCQTDDGLLILDQHAAHERVVYETLKAGYQNSKLEIQQFLVPLNLELSMKEAHALEKNLIHLSRLGLEIEHFGGGTFLLRAVPSILLRAKWDDFLKDIISLFEEGWDGSGDQAMDRIFTVMACHGALRAGQRLSTMEMEKLLEQLEKMDLPTNCPHGRPISRTFEWYELEKMFKRVP